MLFLSCCGGHWHHLCFHFQDLGGLSTSILAELSVSRWWGGAVCHRILAYSGYACLDPARQGIRNRQAMEERDDRNT